MSDAVWVRQQNVQTSEKLALDRRRSANPLKSQVRLSRSTNPQPSACSAEAEVSSAPADGAASAERSEPLPRIASVWRTWFRPF
jgi:hypothetical protein